MRTDDLIAGLIVAALGLAFLLAAPALTRLQVRLLEWQLAWLRGPGGPWLMRIVGLVLLAAGVATLVFGSMR